MVTGFLVNTDTKFVPVGSIAVVHKKAIKLKICFFPLEKLKITVARAT